MCAIRLEFGPKAEFDTLWASPEVSAEVWLNPTNLTAFVRLEAEFAVSVSNVNRS
jgi:hypothetical protein